MSELGDLSVLIVDCQTTGATPRLGAVLEVGWCWVRPSVPALEQLESHWIRLPEGERISSHVRRLTGYDEQKRVGAIAPEAAWLRLRANMGASPVPTAIHFARFEIGFLRDWAERFEHDAPFPFDPVCVHAIACRLYPDLPRRSIRALAGYLGHSLDLTRHALGHVEATAFIWRRLSLELEARGIDSWAALGAWLARPEAQPTRSKKHRYPLPSARYRALPDAPGVYQLLRSNGDVLYVGKAASLKKRVTSHFAVRSTREHSIEMLTQVNDIKVTLTPSPLEAALLENECIKALRPPYNLQLTSYDRLAWFVAANFHQAATQPDCVHRIGPLPSAHALRPLAALIAVGSGEPPVARLRAHAVAAPERWAPDELTFGAGYEVFALQHLAVGGSSRSSVRRALLRAAKRLVACSRSVTDEVEDSPDEAKDSSSSWGWSVDRVTRHLERALMQAYRLLRRAMWLRLLQNSCVVYQEPGDSRFRFLALRRAELLVAREVASDNVELELAANAPQRPDRFGAAKPLERTQYDRLRILTSELKRVRRDGGVVRVYVAPQRRLGVRVLDAIFDSV